MDPRRFSDLITFGRVAEMRSFTAAAQSLGVTQSAVSQTVKRLEADLGIRLLSRSTRSLTPTAAGEQLLATLAPNVAELEVRLADLERLREEPGGQIRVTCGKHAASTLVWPAFSRLLTEHPGIDGELSVEDRYVDIVAERFDIGIRMRDDLALDMISVPVGPPLRSVVVGAPAYLGACAAPGTPRDLSRHRCIGFRNAGGTLSPWSFEKDGRRETVKVTSSIVVNDGDTLVAAACAGMGLAYMLEDLAAPFLKNKQLVEVLGNWSPPFPGYHAYYSSRRHPPPAVTLFLDLLCQDTGT